MDLKSEVFELLSEQKHAVISTVNSKGNPESAMVGFAQNKDLELIFGTDKTTRKAQNLKFSNNVSVVINGDSKCVQYEGEAQLISGNELEKFLKIFFEKIPGLSKYAILENQIYYKITPNWIRFIDHNFSPGKISELTFE